jgi:hypothetical protein
MGGHEMAEREPRVQWSQEHREHVFWFEKGIATFAMLVGVGLMVLFRGDGVIWIGVGAGIFGAGLYGATPSVRPILSAIVERLPGFGKKGE